MDHIINQTQHGKVFKCNSCKKIHIEFNNLNFNFTHEEYEHFANYFLKLNGDYWEKLNTDSMYRRKILVPLDHKNLNLLLNKSELEELKKLLYLKPKAQNTIQLLSFKMIDFNTFNN